MSANIGPDVGQRSSGPHEEHASRIVDGLVILVGVLEHFHKHLGDLLGVPPFSRPARLEDGRRCGSRAVSSRKNVVLERGFSVSGFVPSDLRFPQRSSTSICGT